MGPGAIEDQELDPVRSHRVTAPVGRPRNIARCELPTSRIQVVRQNVITGKIRALLECPRGELRIPVTPSEERVRVRFFDSGGGADHPDLTLHVIPPERQGNARIRFDLDALGGPVARAEDEAPPALPRARAATRSVPVSYVATMMIVRRMREPCGITPGAPRSTGTAIGYAPARVIFWNDSALCLIPL